MKYQLQRALSIFILCLGSACATTTLDRPSRPAATSRPGVVLEEIGQGSVLEKAGLRPGDLLFAWERPPDPPVNPKGGEGEIRTAFDWLWMKTEQAPRGTVRLHGKREGMAILFEVPRGDWDARVRPSMAADLLKMYSEGRRLIDAGLTGTQHRNEIPTAITFNCHPLPWACRCSSPRGRSGSS